MNEEIKNERQPARVYSQHDRLIYTGTKQLGNRTTLSLSSFEEKLDRVTGEKRLEKN
jgi:hypothetical protein